MKAAAVVVELDLGDMVELEGAAGEPLRTVAAHEHLHRLFASLSDLLPHSRDLALGHDVPVRDQDDAVREQIDLVEDVTRDEHVLAFAGQLTEQFDRLGADHRVETVERLVEHHDLRMVGDRLRQLDPLPHALAVARDPPVRRVDQAHTLQGLRGEPLGFAPAQAVQQQVGEDELPPRHTPREGVVLGAVAEVPEQILRPRGGNAEDADLAPGRPQQAREQVHQGALARSVRSDQAGDPGLDHEVHAVDAQHVAVELRDVAQGDVRRAAHLTTSKARTRRYSSAADSATSPTAASQAAAPGIWTLPSVPKTEEESAAVTSNATTMLPSQES